MRESIVNKGALEGDGECEGESHKISGKIVDNAVVVQEYSTELRQWEGVFDELTEKMQTHSFCNSETKSCQTGESILGYNVKTKDCNISFLKSSDFIEIKGEQVHDHKQASSISHSEKQGRRSIRASTKKTPTVLMSALTDDGMRFIRKESISKCGKQIYLTNYKGLYFSKVKIEEAKEQVHNADIKYQTRYIVTYRRN